MAGATEWEKDQKLVMHELKRINESLCKFDDKIDNMSSKIAKLEVKSSVWGAIGGMISSGIAMAGVLIKNMLGK